MPKIAGAEYYSAKMSRGKYYSLVLIISSLMAIGPAATIIAKILK